MTIGIWFLIVFVIYCVGMSLVGFFTSKKIKGVDDFMLSGRTIGPIAIAFTLVTSFSSGSGWLGSQGLGYKLGYASLNLWLPFFLGLTTSVVVLSSKARIFSEKFKTTTPSDFVGERYESKAVKYIAAILTIAFLVPMMMAQFQAGAAVMASLFGWNYYVAILVTAGVVALYTTLGGFFAVVVTDVAQGFIMMLGSIILVSTALIKVGGFSGLVSTLQALGKPDWYIFSLVTPAQAGVPLSAAIGYWFSGFIGAMAVPYLVVKFFATKDTSKGNISRLAIATLVIVTCISLISILGPVAFALNPNLSVPDMAVPTMIIAILHPLVASFLLVAIFAAIMSTISSQQILVSSIVVQDFMRRTGKFSEKSMVYSAKALTAVVGLIAMLLAMFKPWPFIVLLLTFGWGLMGILYFSSLIIGLYWKRATKWGAIASMIIGSAIEVILVLGFGLSVGYAYIFAFPISVILFFAVSLLDKPMPKEVVERVTSYSG